ncbi:YqcI/YcgG family protein [Actinospica sp. MGRD01-02]|uniref:YqcI/YcgG family protein n=1 Tax=Actinospica acidithermotolerans TaxID=2828514 RepID=A0A941IF08_9ACTN|nr:YqcI/YcgG family protein [Actinospica acidithermotolerans]MBR7825810.1 YqcI/YcgG family protein [Actinospica acidithermotolerans]
MYDQPSAEFVAIQQAASCPFAGRAKVHSAAPFAGRDARAAGAAAVTALKAFAAHVEEEELDGFLIELTDPEHGESAASLAVTTREVISGLLDASGMSVSEAFADADNEHWWLTLSGTRWFVLAFAPCYPATSTRATFGSQSTFLLLQPVASFDRHATPRGSVIPEAVRRGIQKAYTTSGRPYDTELAMQDVEALKFVWPMPGSERSPIRWWLAAR